MRRLLAILGLALLAVPISAIGALVIVYTHDKYITKAESNARSAAHMAHTVRSMGESAEALYVTSGRLPTPEELNCQGVKCKPFTLITRQVDRDSNGTIRATYTTLGVPFSPVDTLTAHWDSRARTTEFDNLTQPNQWKMRFIPWLILGIVTILTPWLMPFAQVAVFFRERSSRK